MTMYPTQWSLGRVDVQCSLLTTVSTCKGIPFPSAAPLAIVIRTCHARASTSLNRTLTIGYDRLTSPRTQSRAPSYPEYPSRPPHAATHRASPLKILTFPQLLQSPPADPGMEIPSSPPPPETTADRDQIRRLVIRAWLAVGDTYADLCTYLSCPPSPTVVRQFVASWHHTSGLQLPVARTTARKEVRDAITFRRQGCILNVARQISSQPDMTLEDVVRRLNLDSDTLALVLQCQNQKAEFFRGREVPTIPSSDSISFEYSPIRPAKDADGLAVSEAIQDSGFATDALGPPVATIVNSDGATTHHNELILIPPIPDGSWQPGSRACPRPSSPGSIMGRDHQRWGTTQRNARMGGR